MKHYEEQTRGTFQRIDCANQLVSFTGMKFRGRNGLDNVTPTDIDGCIQLDYQNCIIFFELKHSGDAPTGQMNALATLADKVQAGGANCIVLVAVHNTNAPEVIIAKDAIVVASYRKGKWTNVDYSRGFTLLYCINEYIRWIERNNIGAT